MKKLIAIDGNSLMHRAFYALPPMTTKTGKPTGAVFGFLSMLLKLVQMQPDYLLVAFDMHGPTFRHEKYAEYKAGRRATPDDLRTQFPMLKDLLRAMGICVCECPRFEADDILGTFARLANEQGDDALLVTGDRDALQLIGPHTHVLMTKKGITDTVEFDESVLMEQYGLTPDRMPDLKALMGDGSDNIPGIPGIGEKTALKLLEKYGAMENALARAAEEKGALQQKLLNGGESARMSYELGLIDTHAPVEIGMEACAFQPARMAGGLPMMRELELRSLIDRIPKGEADPMAEQPKEKAEHIRVDEPNALNQLAKALMEAPAFACHVDGAFTVSMDGAVQYDIVMGATLLDAGLDETMIYAALKEPMESERVKKVMFDSKRMRHAAARFGVTIQNVAFDAMIADYLLHAIHPADSLSTLCGEWMGQSESGAAMLMRLWQPMAKALAERSLTKLYEEIELPLIDVLYGMERVGFALDRPVLEEMSARFKKRIGEIAKEIYEQAGEEFNILSTKQLGAILFDKLGLPVMKKTKTGYSTDSEVLEGLYDLNPIVPLVLEYRTLTKLCSTFVDGLITMIDPKSGRVHTSFNQNVTATGRISSTEPNLQNIPVRTELGKEIRKAFSASDGCVLVDADYSQIELRLLAAMSGDQGMIQAFLDGADIHRRTASEVFGVPFGEVTSQQRSAAKAVNFGIVYGISDFGLARQLGVTRNEAGRYIELYFERYPGIQAFLRDCVDKAKAAGYAVTLFGRRRELPELNSSNYNTRSFGERVAMNMPIQGTAADVIKLAMVRVERELCKGGYRAKLVLQIHDELIIDTPYEEMERVKALLVECMECVLSLAVPLKVDVETGKSWFDTK